MWLTAGNLGLQGHLLLGLGWASLGKSRQVADDRKSWSSKLITYRPSKNPSIASDVWGKIVRSVATGKACIYSGKAHIFKPEALISKEKQGSPTEKIRVRNVKLGFLKGNQGLPKERLGCPKEDLGFPKETKDLLRKNNDSLMKTKDFLRKSLDVLRKTFDFVRKSEGFLRNVGVGGGGTREAVGRAASHHNVLQTKKSLSNSFADQG